MELTTLIRHIIEEATGEPARTQVWGPNWYQTTEDEVMHKVAERLGDGAETRFDWSSLHEVLATLPTGAGSHEILPSGGHETARWWPTKLPSGGQVFCPR